MATASQADTNYFSQVKKTIGAALTPFHAQALAYVNSNGTLNQVKAAYAGWVGAAQTNGAGPNSDPVAAPWSFDSFALGIPNLKPKGVVSKTGLVFRGR